MTITWPWVVAFAFGLLHGFGFAGALVELGLPQGDIPLALFSFNVGVELGQLIFIAAILAVVAPFGRIFAIPRQAIIALGLRDRNDRGVLGVERLDAMFLTWRVNTFEGGADMHAQRHNRKSPLMAQLPLLSAAAARRPCRRPPAQEASTPTSATFDTATAAKLYPGKRPYSP